ncbi:MAG: polyprenyl synthetase family protein [Candidatus Azobacteroides pseudotrichonymphae]|jgi:geranylgeranyl diphosphate synthase type II|uniref:Geranylgeranyl pyrophosphate synthetase n=1 Tax=Azobacteroides pseudotrichonymphae genomovar. CFP2 TaxID=511995 RepID=B6YRD3_AZOPC|nr:polyprenyl synthetase family protein [Candidatus Azobacteroides pseudotrichonymphae]MDR0530242.1 polyprenyl synthetase family protein [Bacteroidales bacterium OttesenSCG-928-I14]BAG83755.1 geranylgeranyl pyrophosphate synthetase [Candidatus Azobacteroides pseudotrichonymphae genomovar. CFP2]GMO35125.1 MAG: polyprenyl synthetase family protein [Candidatus Azobacteroides pseudotrichonymphae]
MNYQEALPLITKKIAEISYPKQPKELYEPMIYLLSMKGKRIRPIFTLMACRLFQENIKCAIDVALAWEIFHNFTLMHDDIIDNAFLRRGQSTVHTKWNKTIALLAGDSMLILAYKYIAKSPLQYRDILLHLFSSIAAKVCEGQAYDMLLENRLDVRKKEYLELVRLKTATLLSACLYSGAIVGGASGQDAKFLQDFGINLGIAFQIQDDMLDVYGNSSFGKEIGSDIFSNRRTYLLINALNICDEMERKELLFWLNEKEQKEEKITAIISLYDKMEIKKKTCRTIESYYRRALFSLKKVNVEEEKKVDLVELTKELMNRTS